MLKGNGISAYWYRDEINFGDGLTPLLLQHYGYTPVYTRPCKARLAAIGSILEHIPNSFPGLILGSGFLLEESFKTFPQATVLAVRGELTRERLGKQTGVVLGDPGILASRFMPYRKSKKYVLGIVPHYSEKQNPVLHRIQERVKGKVTIVDVQSNPLAVFGAIDECEHILSSSLHALIVSDSLGIPNRWIAYHKLVGGRFKFDDYYSSIGLIENPTAITGGESLSEFLAMTWRKPAGAIEHMKGTIHRLLLSLNHFRLM